MRLSDDLGWLTYCLNIHPTQTWSETKAALAGPVADVKRRIAPDQPFAVGLRFSADVMAALQDPSARAEAKALIAEHDYRCVTMNGFPYGPFHGTTVKAEVYQPDWRTDERVRYTCALADFMAEIAPEGEAVSLSTVPGTFKPLGAGAEAEMADRLLQAAAHCARLRDRTGVTVALAIEPEPFCFLETIEESVAFFNQHLFSAGAVARFAEMTGLATGAAADALRAHLGLCYDVCHAAVEYEEPAGSIAALQRADVRIHKLQLSAALRVRSVSPDIREALRAFAEPTYLHQVVSLRDGRLRREADLPEALARGSGADGEEWRVHFHVPLFVETVGAFGTTQDFLAEILARHKQEPISNHLEIETYTWDVLPDALRAGSVDEAVAREMNWVLERLT